MKLHVIVVAILGLVFLFAAAKGRCGHGSPCEQLCYELHDGMYECDCKEGYELHQDGYSCYEVNTTMSPTYEISRLNDEDILYQKGASFSAQLSTAVDNHSILNVTNTNVTSNDITATNNGDTSSNSGEQQSTTQLANFLADIVNNNLEQNYYPSNQQNENNQKLHPERRYSGFTVTKRIIDNINNTSHSDRSDHSSHHRYHNANGDSGSRRGISASDHNINNSNDIKARNNYGLHKITTYAPAATTSSTTIVPTPACLLDCGPGGSCVLDDSIPGIFKCLCPLGRGGDTCQKELNIQSPRFAGHSWLAFPALRAAYKHVQLTLEIRPEAYDGIFFLTGERDDMAGDFMALLLHQGFVEFRFDCGSGIGVVRSEETVLLNQWNRLTLTRHRWDAWIQLNDGKHVKGRSKGLFSRITFREPLFIGGPGNTTGLADKLPVTNGLRGCVRHLEINDHAYRFALEPHGDAIKGFGVQECTADRCSRVPCQHGGKCLTSGESAVCLCPLGFSGDLCETRVDLQVPSFNGSSYLRYRGLANSVISWLDLQIILKPGAENGVVLYNGHHVDGSGDFMAVYMNDGYLEFAFDLGTGAAIVKSEQRISMGEWHEVKISRTGRLAVLQVDALPALEVWSPGAFTQLSLPQNLYIGGVPNFAIVSPSVRVRTSFVGCIQKVVINNRPLGILAEALGGANVDNCPHPCVARPCGEDGTCVPNLDYFTCHCKPGYHDAQCSSKGSTSERTSYDSQIPQFSGLDSFLHFTDYDTIEKLSGHRVDINIRFKIVEGNGLLLWTERLSLGLEYGALVLRHRPLAGTDHLIYNLTRIDDGLWHRLRAVWSEGGGSLEVDSAPVVTAGWASAARHLPIVKSLYVGGMSRPERTTRGRYTTGVIGCVADLVLDSEYHIKLIAMSAVGQNVGRCNP